MGHGIRNHTMEGFNCFACIRDGANVHERVTNFGPEQSQIAEARISLEGSKLGPVGLWGWPHKTWCICSRRQS